MALHALLIAAEDNHPAVCWGLSIILVCWWVRSLRCPCCSGCTFCRAISRLGWYPLDGTFLAEFAQESEPDDRLPINAALLKSLVLVLFFGPVLWWLAASRWMRRRQKVCSAVRCWFHSMIHLCQRRGVPTLFLGILLL